MDEYIIRNVKKKDYEQLAKIVADVWCMNQYYSDKNIKILSNLYLAHELTRQNYCRIITVDNKPIGLIALHELKNKKSNIHRPYFIKYLLKTLSSKVGRKTLKEIKVLDKADSALDRLSKRNYDVELSYFFVNSENHGKGYGTILYEEAMKYCIDNKLYNIFLYTDSKSSYKFYEYKGFKLLGSKKEKLDLMKPYHIELYKYEKNLINAK